MTSSTYALTDGALKALRVSESRYRRLFETARDGILLLNATTAQIEDVNPYLIEMLGYSHDEFLGKKLWEVGPFSDIAESKKMFAELQTKGYVRYEDLPLKTKAGAQMPVEFVSNTYDCQGIQVIQCNIRNITDRKRAELATQVAQGQLRALASRLNKVREEETSMLSRELHDVLGQDLTVLKMDLTWITSKLRADQPALKERAKRAIEQTDRSIDTVGNIATRLRPTILDHLGIVAAIEWQAEEFQKNFRITSKVIANIDAFYIRESLIK